jgi:hypothetical protein
VLSSVGRSEWLYGIVGGTDVTKTTELMAELHGTARTNFTRDVLTVNVGIRQKLTDQAILIASIQNTNVTWGTLATSSDLFLSIFILSKSSFLLIQVALPANQIYSRDY